MDSFSLRKAPLIIKYSAEKELNLEKLLLLESKNINLSNKIADFGFVLYEDSELQFQRLVKTTGPFLIQILYKLKPRRIKPQEEKDYEQEYIQSVGMCFHN